MEENKTVSFDKVKIKIKFEQAKRKVINYGKSAMNWCMENKELALGIAAATAVVGKSITKIANAKREDYIHDLRHWDPRTGEYVESRRKLSKRERIDMDNRYRADRNETKLHILDDMGLLK